jgi:hypothetical protein
MIAVIELVAAVVRRTGNRALGTAAMRQLAAFSQVAFADRHRDLGVRLALSGIARGADTAIAAQALIVTEAAGMRCEFLTADDLQARLLNIEAKRRALPLRIVRLPV